MFLACEAHTIDFHLSPLREMLHSVSQAPFWAFLLGDPMEEIWKPVLGYEGCYEVSSLGRVRWVGKKITRTYPGRVLKQLTSSKSQYLCVWLYKNGEGERSSVSRLIAKAFLGFPGGKMQVNHKNGIKTDNRIDNLEWVTHSQNRLHAQKFLNVKFALGEEHGKSKLKNKDIPIIRAFLLQNIPLKRIARMFKVSSTNIRSIRDRKTWGHIPYE